MAREPDRRLSEIALDGLRRGAVRAVFWTITGFAGCLYGWGILVTAVRALLQGSAKR